MGNFPEFESSNLSRDNLGREIGRTEKCVEAYASCKTSR